VRSALGALLVLSFGLLLFEQIWTWYLTTLLIGGALAFILLGKGPPGKYFRKLDDLIYEGEKALVAAALAVMSIVVFLDVVYRTVHGSSARLLLGFSSALLIACLVAGFTRRWTGEVSVAKKLGSGLAAFALIVCLCYLISLTPNGFGWSQKLALCLMLWVGLLGASMATHDGRHIAVDAVRQIVPVELKRSFELLAGTVTVVVAAILTELAIRYVRSNWIEWLESDFEAGVFESVPIPYWAATLAIPIGFGIMAFRFVDVALHGARKTDLLTTLGAGSEAKDT
jgi:TRAP-type C4-dicarboxylate transport system permease small subunit